MMNLIKWLEFEWDLKTLPAFDAKLATRLHLEVLGISDSKAVELMMHRALSSENGWSAFIEQRMNLISTAIHQYVPRNEVTMVAIKDGTRVIAAALVSEKEDLFLPLVAGVYVSLEYRCRGLGTALLYAALAYLKDKGMAKARVVTRANLPSAKYLYPKFNSLKKEVAYSPQEMLTPPIQ
ncbi:MAG: GNAT family N-acetyltransferase [Verrucomicrobiota bacterium]